MMKERTGSSRRSGYSVIELMVAIAIISVLGAIMFPTLLKGREMARRTVCASNMRQLGFALVQYSDDYDDREPPSPAWASAIYPYVGSRQVYVCPSYTGVKTIAYSMNSLLNEAPAGQIELPSRVVTLFETAPRSGSNPSPASDAGTSPNGTYVGFDADNILQSSLFRHVPPEPPSGPLFASHKPAIVGANQSGLNYLFADSHVKFLNYSHVEDATRNDNGLTNDARSPVGTFKPGATVTFNYRAPR